MTLVDFLLARIADDERHALTAKGDTSGKWGSWNHRGHVFGLRDLAVDNDRIAELPGNIDEHVATHSPLRVLAECEAKRRIVALHSWMGPVMAGDPVDGPKSCVTCADHVQPGSPTIPGPCPTLRALALPYADHPDYREEWRP